MSPDDRLARENARLREALTACAEFLDNQADVTDGDDGPQADRAMALLTVVHEALGTS